MTTKSIDVSLDFSRVVAQLKAARQRFKPPPKTVRRKPSSRALALVQDEPAPPPNPVIDWRTQNVISPAGFQGDCNACASFAIAAAIEAHRRIRNAADQALVDAGFLHTCIAHGGTIINPAINCQRGADLGPTLSLTVMHGYALKVPASPYPFPPNACNALPRQGMSPPRPLVGPNATKNALTRGPVTAEIYVWPNFIAYQGQTPVYVPSGGPGYFLHSICIIGYQPNGWLIKNSMGPLWGVQGGFAVIPYGECGLFGPPPPSEEPGVAFEIALP